jgi:hypothetical protein
MAAPASSICEIFHKVRFSEVQRLKTAFSADQKIYPLGRESACSDHLNTVRLISCLIPAFSPPVFP